MNVEVPEDWMEQEDTEDAERRRKRDELDHSRLLDVHRWTDHPEAKKLIDDVFQSHFVDAKADIAKKNLAAVLLDLFVAHCEDPTLKIAVSLSPNEYKANSRYNELHISKKTIDVIKTLDRSGLLNLSKGFINHEIGYGRLSRIWPTEELAKRFDDAVFSEHDIRNHPDRKAVILRRADWEAGGDAKRKQRVDVEFEDIEKTLAMEAILQPYNDLLHNAFIDIPRLNSEGMLDGVIAKRDKIRPSPHNKFVTRVFNRGDLEFNHGGRFYGGWWQRCPKNWRPYIFINGKPTNELDYSGLHIVMAYAQKGICYWSDVGVDPYTIEPLDFAQENAYRRSVAKSLMLVLLNSKNKNSAYKAFRDNASNGSPEKGMTDVQLEQVYQALVQKHTPIRDCFHADQGIKLMNLDSQITEKILATFTARGIPVLTLHDSYIVQCGHEDYLNEVMMSSFEAVMGVPLQMNGGSNQQSYTASIKESGERLEDLEAELMMYSMPYPETQNYLEFVENRYFDRLYSIKSNRYNNYYNKYKRYKELTN